MQLVRAADLLIADVDALLAALKRRAFEYKYAAPSAAATASMPSPPPSASSSRASMPSSCAPAPGLSTAREEIAICAISGAVGTFANIDPRVEAHVAETMGLAVEPVSTQVIPRDRHAAYFAALGVVAGSLERLATEIRHLQRTEVLEAEEYFSEGPEGLFRHAAQAQSGADGKSHGPRAHGARLCTPAMENVALWHERDISHSSVERYIAPDATITLDFALARAAGVVDKLIVYPERMKENLDRTRGLVHSQRVLLALTQAGASREDSYRLVQRNAMRAWNGEGALLELLKADKDVGARAVGEELERLFDLDYHLKHVDTIFRRVFG